MSFSNKIKHFFHIVSNIRPIVWIGLYVALTPIFATIYWALPDGQFRIPDNAGTDWGSWFYYSIVTITTLGFGDYTPAHGWAQAVTAIEVMCGLIFLGFFLNAVGAMKSEIDVESEVEKQKRAHYTLEKQKLSKFYPQIIHLLNLFLSYCYAITTPVSQRSNKEEFDPDFKFNDLQDLFKPSGLPSDHTSKPVVIRMMHCASNTSLALDSIQQKIDLTLWPDLLENCFAFVANYQMFSDNDLYFLSKDSQEGNKFKTEKIINEIKNTEGDLMPNDNKDLKPVIELYYFIKENSELASRIETALINAIKSPN